MRIVLKRFNVSFRGNGWYLVCFNKNVRIVRHGLVLNIFPFIIAGGYKRQHLFALLDGNLFRLFVNIGFMAVCSKGIK